MTKFAPEYVKYVLNDNFEDAKSQFLSPLMAIHYAHLVMLAAREIVSPADAHAIREALDSISQDQVRQVQYDGSYEDLFFYIERLIVNACGQDVAGRLHTARSRNDIDMTMYRVEQLERDAARLTAAYERTNRNPLGACAITGTGFPIDRHLTSRLLGFSGPTVNTYGSIATVDYLLESTSAAAVTLAGFGRFAQDLLLWSTAEFHYVRFGDGFVQSSSIMPQKRNPVAIEHARAIASKALGQTQAIFTSIHNTPFGDIVDTEDDLQPLVFSMFRDATRAIRIVAAAMTTAEFDAAALEARAGEGWTTLTELADTLARGHNLPFRIAHGIAARLMALRDQHPATSIGELLAEASGGTLSYSDAALTTILSPRHFVTVRQTLGGPAPAETRRAAEVSRRQLDADESWHSKAVGGLASAERLLAERSAAL
jgi:argininosuccinate lyase